MDDQRREEAPSETAQAWDSVRRLREPVAWTLLVLTAIGLLIGAWELFGMPGTPPITVPSPVPITGPVPAATFGLRAAAVAPQFVAGGIFLLPILSVVLVAFTGGLTDRARQVVQTAISIQAVTLGLGLLSWLAALGAHVRPRHSTEADPRPDPDVLLGAAHAREALAAAVLDDRRKQTVP